jgi:tripartite-type tricarboxylate transporter receptor subunit TctC
VFGQAVANETGKADRAVSRRAARRTWCRAGWRTKSAQRSASRSSSRTGPARKGIVGIEAAKNSAADGYTFVYANVSNISINPHVHEKLPYDGLRDLAPVTQLGRPVLAMVVPPTLNVKSLKEFIEYAKANRGKVSFASFGAGSTSHIYGEMLKASAGIDMTHVPYKGAGPAVQDTMAGHTQMAIQDLGSVGPFVTSGSSLRSP